MTVTRWTFSPVERVQVERQARDEGLALAGLHLGDVALVEHDAAHQLDVEEPLPRLALARLANGRERLEEDVLERLAVLEPLLELRGLREQLGIAQRLEVGLERGDVRGLLGEALDPPSLTDPQDLLEAAEARSRACERVPAHRRAAGRARFRTVPSRFRHELDDHPVMKRLLVSLGLLSLASLATAAGAGSHPDAR